MLSSDCGRAKISTSIKEINGPTNEHEKNPAIIDFKKIRGRRGHSSAFGTP